MADGEARGADRPRYSRRRAFFDAVALIDIVGLAVIELTTIRDTGLGFKLHSLAVLVLVTGIWLALRRHEHPMWLVLVLECAVLGHLAGRLIMVDGLPLYRVTLAHVPMDKVIHAFNSMAGATFLAVFFRRVRMELRGWEWFVVVMAACGGGALVEIVEYGSVVVLPSTHVGDYANNAQDLIANLAGALVGWGVVRLVAGRAGSERSRATVG